MNNIENLSEEMPVYCEETVQIWLDQLKIAGTDIKEEIEEVLGTISNERLWLKGASNEEEAFCHMQNIADLSEYLNRLTA